jgi:hypothetical protein
VVITSHNLFTIRKIKKAHHLFIWQFGLVYFAKIIDPQSSLINKLKKSSGLLFGSEVEFEAISANSLKLLTRPG